MKTIQFRTGAAMFALAFAFSAGAASAGDGAPSPASPASIPASAFFDYPDLWEPLLSPSGDHVAVLVRGNGGHRQLAVLDTGSAKELKIVASFQDADIDSAHWVDDRRLVFSIGHETGLPSSRAVAPGLFAVDIDGSDLRTLIRSDGAKNMQTGTNIVSHVLTADHHFLRTLNDGSGEVVVLKAVVDTSPGVGTRYHQEVRELVPLRLDTRTGRTHRMVDKTPDHAREWIIDGLGHVAGVLADADGETALLVPVDEGSNWKEVVRFPTFTPSARSFTFPQAAADGQVYVTLVNASDNAGGLYRLDMATGAVKDAPLVKVKGFDFDGQLVQDWCTRKLLGVNFVSDAASSAWFDPAMTEIQKKIDSRLPGRSNQIDVPRCAKSMRMIVVSSSDHVPPQFYLYDAKDDSLRLLASSRRAIDPRLMADTDFYRIKARDGLEIPVYVTKPRGKGPWPTVVLVHGGPFLRGWAWAWDDEPQFLASRGYLVVMPEFRGSGGYGFGLWHAGVKQWGLAMQDDIADATRWAAAQGWEDPARVCIAGGSYGGYAALMGLVRYPELYRCGVARSAVADIAMMYDTWWSDASDDWKDKGMPEMVGDPVKDARQLEATSPLKQASRITRPLLLEHGSLDRRVPIEQARALRSALEAAHAPLTWIEYPDEGHGFWLQQDKVEFFTREAEFLEKSLAAPPAAQ
jgi:dipeptidyl aminopeptidase/acylaminoacyl peptidase